MPNLLKVPNTTVTDIRVIGTADILSISYPSTTVVRIVYKVANNPSITPAASPGTLGVVVLRCTFNSADTTYGTHDAFVAAIAASNSSNSNPVSVFICPDLPGGRTVTVEFSGGIAQV